MRELRSIRRETDERAARYIIEYVCFYNERDRERERKERERRKGMEERGGNEGVREGENIRARLMRGTRG